MNLGLKLWSINTDNYLEQAKKLYQDGWYDYIELYVVPETIDTINKWKELKIPFTLHAPHFVHGVNLADKEKASYNLRVFDEVEKFRIELEAQYVVVHSGMDGNINETIRQLKLIKPKNMLIENKPLIPPLKENSICRGAYIEEIKEVIDEIGCGFCLDIGHAMCTANSLKIDPCEYLNKFQKLNPYCYHLSDNFVDSEKDGHMHLGKGNYDFARIFDIIDTNKNIAIETNKISKIDLEDFIEDVKWLRNLK